MDVCTNRRGWKVSCAICVNQSPPLRGRWPAGQRGVLSRQRLRKSLLMPEMPHARKDHGDAMLVGGGDNFLVAHGAARLDDGGSAGLDG